MRYQNIIYGFLLQVPTTFLTFPKIVHVKIPSLLLKISFWVVPSLFIMIQNQQEFKIQTNKVS